jgi:hypothetical protein
MITLEVQNLEINGVSRIKKYQINKPKKISQLIFSILSKQQKDVFLV